MAAEVTTFTLEGRGLKLDTAADIGPHLETVKENPGSIKTLNLSGNTIGVAAAQALAPVLSSLAALETANLADIFTSRLLSEIPPALDAILTALLPLKKLHTVNLSDNAFGLNTQAPLVSFLEQHIPLRHLILNNNGLGPEAGTLVANALSRLAEAKGKSADTTAQIETIICGRNRLENGSATAWARAFAAHSKSLKEVRLAQNGIRVEGMTAMLRQGLRHAQKLEILELQDNLLTVPGATALADVLPGWSGLRELAVQDTLLRPRGGVILAETLAKRGNEKLQVLRLQHNEIEAKGVEALLHAIHNKSLPNLRRVELNGNKFDEEDPAIQSMRDVLHERRKAAGADEDGVEWGLDELDELEDASEDEGEEQEEEEEAGEEQEEGDDSQIVKPQDVATTAEADLRLADEAETQNVPQEKDKEIDALADRLSKTTI